MATAVSFVTSRASGAPRRSNGWIALEWHSSSVATRWNRKQLQPCSARVHLQPNSSDIHVRMSGQKKSHIRASNSRSHSIIDKASTKHEKLVQTPRHAFARGSYVTTIHNDLTQSETICVITDGDTQRVRVSRQSVSASLSAAGRSEVTCTAPNKLRLTYLLLSVPKPALFPSPPPSWKQKPPEVCRWVTLGQACCYGKHTYLHCSTEKVSNNREVKVLSRHIHDLKHTILTVVLKP